MANTVYSTHYAAPGSAWARRTGGAQLAGFFQIKEDRPQECGGHTSPAVGFDFTLSEEFDPIDYDVARHWPHP
jgi:hypothetical protein